MSPLGKSFNEHLSGSHATLHLHHALIKANPPSAGSNQGLRAGILKNRLTLEKLVDRSGLGRARGMKMISRVASHIALLRFCGQRLDRGGLGPVEALEALEALEAVELGVHGKTLRRRGLHRHQDRVSKWQGEDFEPLLQSAEARKATVESLRFQAVQAAFYQVLTAANQPLHV